MTPPIDRAFDTDLIDRAREFAASAHATQTRRFSGLPYVVHLDSVVSILRSHAIDAPHVLAAAFLHDTVEDTSTTMQNVFDAFGEDVTELVYWLTDAEQGKRAMRKTMSAWRLGGAPFDAKLIKLADFIDNTEDICRNDRHFAPVYLGEKAKILDMMARSEGARLTALPIFAAANRIKTIDDV